MDGINIVGVQFRRLDASTTSPRRSICGGATMLLSIPNVTEPGEVAVVRFAFGDSGSPKDLNLSPGWRPAAIWTRRVKLTPEHAVSYAASAASALG